jgi:hypothetical protein
MSGLIPHDEAVRARVRGEHGTSFVISAGAGTGKTTLLIDRIVSIVLEGFLRLDQIAAVTFTENAATTLKLRLRDALERARATATDPAVVNRASEGLATIERAQVSTIHALCTAMLQERPIEAGVTPGFRVADEALSDFIFEEAWEEWLQDRLTGHDTLLEAVILSRIPLEKTSPVGDPMTLRKLARRLVSQRDLAPHIAAAGIDPKAGARLVPGENRPRRRTDRGQTRGRHSGGRGPVAQDRDREDSRPRRSRTDPRPARLAGAQGAWQQADVEGRRGVRRMPRHHPGHRRPRRRVGEGEKRLLLQWPRRWPFKACNGSTKDARARPECSTTSTSCSKPPRP